MVRITRDATELHPGVSVEVHPDADGYQMVDALAAFMLASGYAEDTIRQVLRLNPDESLWSQG